MGIRQRADAIDPAAVYRVYAALTGATGLVLSFWGPLWLGAHLQGVPWGRAALIRVAGAGLLAAACFAAAMAGVSDPVARRRGLLWFAGGHAVLFTAVVLQGKAVWGPGLGDWAAGLLFLVAIALGYLWSTAEGDPAAPRPALLSLFGAGARSSTERLCSVYERQIREVAGQEERNRLARELHDSIKQQIFAIQTSAATAQVRFENDAAGSRLAIEQVRTAAREAMAEMEAMLDQLRAVPLENVGLVEALKKQCEALAVRTGAKVEFQAGYLPPGDALAPGAQQAIFRVAQEALANVARHARARNVKIALAGGSGRLAITVEDDGAGFSPGEAGGGMGIPNMRARAQEFDGEFALETRPGGGTRVGFSVPYEVESAREYGAKALSYGLLLAFSAVLGIKMRSPSLMAPAGVAVIGIWRETRAWLRTRSRGCA